jgi:hypothetical protein
VARDHLRVDVAGGEGDQQRREEARGEPDAEVDPRDLGVLAAQRQKAPTAVTTKDAVTTLASMVVGVLDRSPRD